jgi:hypothetical protein
MRPRLPAWTIVLLLAAIVAQGFYAAHLNRLYYARFAPFFDSMAYTNVMANVLSVANNEGLARGLSAALGKSTVSLPWIITAVLAPWLPYSRLVGVWMQEFWMGLLALSVLIYWRRYRRARVGLALLWTIPPLSFYVIYQPNGGLSDFRMDLMLYLLMSLIIVWYLITRETTSRLPWLLSGIFIAGCCMNRATAPAYLGMTFGPVLAARWWFEPQSRVWLIRRVAAFWIPASIIGLLPVIKNWDYIHYYYFVWGAAPTAHLPISKSVVHIAAAGLNMGIGVAAAAAILLGIQIIPRLGRGHWPEIDWTLIWLACAPALLLVVTGAGPNPYTAMPMVFGSLLFSMAPFRDGVQRRRLVWSASILLALVCGYQAVTGYRDHIDSRGGYAPSMAAMKSGIQLMRDQCRLLRLRHAEFVTSHLSDFQATAIRNVLIYEFGARPKENALLLPDGLTLASDYEGVFSPAVPVAWAEVPGATEDAKFTHLSAQANEHVHFFFLPDDASIEWMELHLPYNYINVKIRRLKRDVLASGMWAKIGSPLRITNNEVVELYLNTAISQR